MWEGEDLLGFGALKELESRAGEIKSMRTADVHLRRGVAATILDHIITEAHQRSYTRLSLETGSGPAFEPALKLYRKYGFIEGGAFGDYEKSPFNQFLHLDLVSTQAGTGRAIAVESRRSVDRIIRPHWHSHEWDSSRAVHPPSIALPVDRSDTAAARA